SGVATRLPTRRPDLVIRPLGDRGRYVIKDPTTGVFFTFREQEHFLLGQLDGERDAATVCKAFEETLNEPLNDDERAGFVNLARRQGLLRRLPALPESNPDHLEHAPAPAPPAKVRRQSLLYWRTNLFDPDRFFDWLEPKIRLIWTPAFLVVSASAIIL